MDAEYDIGERIYEGARSLVYRARRRSDGVPVVVKCLRARHPTPAQLAAFAREHDITVAAAGEGVIGVLDFHPERGLVLEDIGGRSLAHIRRERRFSVEETLRIAIQVARALERIHDGNVVHRDLNPANVVLDEASGVARIIDFGIAQVLTRETATPTSFVGTPRYASPEQTGRMNRPIDHRSDLYSFGVMLYEMLTHAPPFDSRDRLELVHAHVARVPTAANEVDPRVPAALSDIVGTLLQKEAERRYLGARGLRHDLERVLEGLTGGGGLSFPLRQRDFDERLRIPVALYGRESELATLSAACTAAAAGRARMLLVAGYSGIGKTSLVREVRRLLAGGLGRVCEGKYDQFRRGEPYSGFLDAVRDLVRQLLADPEDVVAAARARVLTELGANGRVLVELVEELEGLIGPQPEVETLPPAESRNRLQLAMAGLVRALATADRPLVLFLDDLQWADLPSFELIERTVGDPSLQHALIVGAYRDNEVGLDHAIFATVRALQRLGATVETLHLGALREPDVIRLVSDTVLGAPGHEALAKACRDRTGGNAFFLNRFLESLHQDGLLRFDVAEAAWRFDLQAIAARPVTENVVDFLAERIGRLPPDERRCIRVAAALGDRFDLDLLAAAAGSTRRSTLDALSGAIRAELVVPEADGFWYVRQVDESHTNFGWRFAHDRIRQAAHALLEPEEAERVHLRAARHLLRALGDDAPEQGVFDLVGHLTAARSLLTAEEWLQLEDLQLLAGRRALQSAAFDAAHRFLSAAIEGLEPDAWAERYPRALELHLEAARAAWLGGDRPAMERLVRAILAEARETLDRVAAREIELDALVAQQRFSEAVSTGLDVLRQLGVTFPEEPGEADVGAAIVAALTAFRATTPDAIVALPEVHDPTVAYAIRIQNAIMSSAYLARPAFLPLLSASIVQTTLRHGVTRHAPWAFAVLGIVMNTIDQIDVGQLTAEVALRLIDRWDDRAVRARAEHVLYNQVKTYVEPLRPAVEAQMHVFRLGMDTGDLEYAAWALQAVCCNGFYAGLELPELTERMDRYLALMRQHQQVPAYACAAPWRQLSTNLAEGAEVPWKLVGPGFDEAEQMRTLRAANFRGAACIVTTTGLFARYLFRELESAVDWADAGAEFLDGAASTYHIVWWHQYRALAWLGLGRPVEGIAKSRERLQTWLRFSTVNHQHRVDLVEAEVARVEGRFADALRLYDSAIRHARENGFLHEQALANELAGRYFLQLGIDPPARAYLSEALWLWRRWGAVVKAAHLEGELPALLRDVSAPPLPAEITSATWTQSSQETGDTTAGLDVETLFKAASAISGEIHLDLLPARILEVAMQNAGATHGMLLLDHQGMLLVGASISADGSAPVRPGTALTLCSRLAHSVATFVARSGRDVLVSDVREDARWRSVAPSNPVSVICVPIVHQAARTGVLYLENELVGGAFAPQRLQLLTLLASQAAIAIENARLYRNLERSLETQERLLRAQRRFVPTPFLESLARRDISEVTLGDSVRKEMSVLFADMRGFTGHVSGMSGSENIGFINEFLSYMEPPVHRHGGFVDSYIGDAIMALFDHADGAVDAAIGMLAGLAQLNQARGVPIACGFGIDTGLLTLGTIGTENRVKCGVIGDCVNVASRVESLTRLYGVPLLTTERTAARLKRPHRARHVDRVVVKGHTEPVGLVEIYDGDPEPLRDAKDAVAPAFSAALERYYAGDFFLAAEGFASCRAVLPDDPVLARFAARSERLLAAPPEHGWDGVERLTHK